MSEFLSKINIKFLESLVSALLLGMLFSITTIGLVSSAKDKETIHVKCSDTTCDVKIINDMCFVKLGDLDTSLFISVECDKKRTGSYNITLPCDVDKDGTYKINCDENNDLRTLAIVVFGTLESVVFCFLILAIGLTILYGYIYMTFDQSIEETKSSKEEPPKLNYIELEESAK